MRGCCKKTIISAMLLVLALFVPAGSRTLAATQNVEYEVTYAQTAARTITDMVNALRKEGSWYWNEYNTAQIATGSLPELVYDYDLEQTAMRRAAELAIYYDHERPDGSSCSTAYSEYSRCGENIAAGYGTAAGVFDAWREENCKYEGQGHRRNMLDSGFTAIGIGHVICDGTHYWAMELRNPVVSTAQTAAENGVRSITVPVNTAHLDKITVSAPCPSQMTIGETYGLSLQCLLYTATASGWPCRVPVSAGYTVTSDSSCISVDGYTLIALQEGTANITVAASSAYGSPSVNFSIKVERIDLAYARISLAQTEYSYTGSPICPRPVITYQGRTLTEGTDYELTYARNTKCTRNTGGANVMAVGTGRFKGNLAERFEITAADISAMTASLSQTVFTYDGYTKEPDVIITGLNSDTDYRVTYENNRSVGKAKAIVTGTGNYKGTLTLEFTIKGSSAGSKGEQASEGILGVPVSLKKPVIRSVTNVKTRKIKVIWEKQPQVNGYELRLQIGKKTVKTVMIRKPAAVKKTVTKLKKGKTYKVSIRSYRILNGKTYYSAWSKKKKVSVKK